nr:phosphatidylglycerol lysyltransferase domain-containing protein [uncultured Cetobacterium sp.]
MNKHIFSGSKEKVISYLKNIKHNGKKENTVEALTGMDEALKNCIEMSDKTDSFLALLGDKEIIFSEDKSSFVMFGKSGHSFITMGDPIGDENSFNDSIHKFYSYCKSHRKDVVFYEIGKEYLSYYIDLGLSFLKIGEYAQVDVENFTLEGSRIKNLRHTHTKIEKCGYKFEVVPVSEVPNILDEIEEVSNEWLGDKVADEKGFSLGKFSKEYLLNFPIAVIKDGEKILAFGNIMATKNKKEIALDLMRYRNDAPSGIMDYIFVCVIKYAQENGYKKFNLGMAPLAGIEEKTASLWNKVERAVYYHGEHFYNFKGLRAFKDKFDPKWEPRYIAYSGPINLPSILKDVTLLISGGLKGLITKK